MCDWIGQLTPGGWSWEVNPHSHLQSGSGEDVSGKEDGDTPRGQRKKIRKILKYDELRTETRDALKEEEERRRRIAEREQLREKLREVKVNCVCAVVMASANGMEMKLDSVYQ